MENTTSAATAAAVEVTPRTVLDVVRERVGRRHVISRAEMADLMRALQGRGLDLGNDCMHDCTPERWAEAVRGITVVSVLAAHCIPHGMVRYDEPGRMAPGQRAVLMFGSVDLRGYEYDQVGQMRRKATRLLLVRDGPAPPTPPAKPTSNPGTRIGHLASQYFTDLEKDARKDTPQNLKAWLWFTCPAELRGEVGSKIALLREQSGNPGARRRRSKSGLVTRCPQCKRVTRPAINGLGDVCEVHGTVEGQAGVTLAQDLGDEAIEDVDDAGEVDGDAKTRGV